MSVFAAILWLIGAIGVGVILKRMNRSDNAHETTQTNESIQPDGTKITEKITTSPDGTRTIERTIERAVGAERPNDVEYNAARSIVTVEAVPMYGT